MIATTIAAQTQPKFSPVNRLLRWCHVWLLCFVTLFITLVAVPAHAQDAIPQTLPADVRVVIDISGSMKQNDPNNLRQPALELLMRLLKDDSKAGVWTFGQYVNMLVPHKPVNDSWRQLAATKTDQINSVGLFTNIGQALENAAYDHKTPNGEFNTSLILLTDGMVDISKDPAQNRTERERILSKVLPELKEAGYTVHTIALSNNADTELLDSIALATDGMAAVAQTADELMAFFLKAFDQAAPQEQVPLDDNRFVIDSSVEEFSALIFRKPGAKPTSLISPDNQTYAFAKEREDVNWYKADNYDLITLKQPIEGEWRVHADMAPDSRVTVVSNLQLLVKPLPNNLYLGSEQPLSFVLQDDGKTVYDANFLRVLDIQASASSSRGDHWQQTLSSSLPPGNGIYTTTISAFTEPGTYRIELLVDGKSFQRQFKHTLSVRDPFAINLNKQVRNGRVEYTLDVKAFEAGIDLEKSNVVAKVKEPSGASSIKLLQSAAEGHWQTIIVPDTKGVYEVTAKINGIDEKGRTTEYVGQSLTFSYPDGDDPFTAAPESKTEPKPEPKPDQKPEKPEAKVDAKPEKPESDIAEPAPEQVDDSGTPWLLYAGLGIGNIFILALAYVAYRVIMGDKDDNVDDVVSSEDSSTADSDSEESPQADISDEDPSMEEVLSTSEAADMAPTLDDITSDIDNLEAAEPDDESASTDIDKDDRTPEQIMADELLSGELDISSDESSEADLPIDESQADDDELAGFSMDDFSTDDEDDKA